MKARKRKMRSEKKMFVPINNTKEYTERTYYTLLDYKTQSTNLVKPSLFWSELANLFINSGQTNFLSLSFMYLNSTVDFFLASAFISSENSNAFDLTSSGESL